MKNDIPFNKGLDPFFQSLSNDYFYKKAKKTRFASNILKKNLAIDRLPQKKFV